MDDAVARGGQAGRGPRQSATKTGGGERHVFRRIVAERLSDSAVTRAHHNARPFRHDASMQLPASRGRFEAATRRFTGAA